MTWCWRIVAGLPVRRSLLEILKCVSVLVSVIFGWSQRSHGSFNHCKVRRENEKAVLDDIDRKDTGRCSRACNKYLLNQVWFFWDTASHLRPRASYILEDMVGFRFSSRISIEEGHSEVLCSPGRSTRGKRHPKPSRQHVQLVPQHSNLEQEHGWMGIKDKAKKTCQKLTSPSSD